MSTVEKTAEKSAKTSNKKESKSLKDAKKKEVKNNAPKSGVQVPVSMTAAKFLERFAKGDFKNPDVSIQVEAGWFDWHCRENSLAVKTRILAKKLKSISKTDKFDFDTAHVYFKNNCPVIGSIYDSILVLDTDTNEVMFTIIPRRIIKDDSMKPKCIAEVYSSENNFKEPMAAGTWHDVRKWFVADAEEEVEGEEVEGAE